MAPPMHDPLDGYEDEIRLIILDVQIEDLVELEKEAATEDERLAITTQLASLRARRNTVTDHHMTKSITLAVIDDADQIAGTLREEEAARGDRQMAERLTERRAGARNVNPTTSQTIQSVQINVDDVFLSRIAAMHIGPAAGLSLLPNDILANEIRDGRPTQHICIICGDAKSYFGVLRAPCGDDYCKPCLQALFETSYTDEALFPPRCCRQVIPLNEVALFLTKSQRDRYELRRIEVNTTNRTYCSNTYCVKFIPPSTTLQKTLTCKQCNTATCSGCKKAGHDGLCPDDKAMKQVLDLAAQEGWRRCNNCQRVIELNFGSASVKLSSAISMAQLGSAANVHNGTKIVSIPEPIMSSDETTQMRQTTQLLLSKFVSRPSSCDNATSVLMSGDGEKSQDLTNVKSAARSCRTSSCSALNASCRLVYDANKIGFD